MDSVWLEINTLLSHFLDEDASLLLGGIAFLFLVIFLYTFFKIKRNLQRILLENIEVFQRVFDKTNNAILILSATNKIIYANTPMIKLLGLKKPFEGKVWKHIPQIKRKEAWEFLDKLLIKEKLRVEQGAFSCPQILFRTPEYEEIHINLHCNRLSLGNRRKKYYTMLTIHDLTLMEKATNLAHRHKLTNLPNQLQAEEDIISFLSKIHLQEKKIAFVLMGFDNYARLRSVLGYKESNEVIIQFAKYLNTIISDMTLSVYHTFDNHFLLIVREIDSALAITNLIETIQIQLALLYKAENASLHLTLSAGIAIYPDSGASKNLLDNTYHALAQAQTFGDGKIHIYMSNQSRFAYDDLRLHNDMDSSLRNGDFEVYYQAIVDVKDERVVAAEALIRWNHPEFGLIPPDHFIALMEKTGFIVRLGAFIIEEVFKQQTRWKTFGFREIEVSINVSMVEITTNEYVENIIVLLDKYQLDPQCLKFEITEGMAMIGESQTEKYFKELKDLGVGISLDDFGTGYTSFGYLKKFPADVLKIDKSLVDYIIDNVEDQRIVHGIIDLGHTLGMKIVVEGVETREMVDMLKTFGCDYMQGYFFAKPLPVLDFQKFIRDN